LSADNDDLRQTDDVANLKLPEIVDGVYRRFLASAVLSWLRTAESRDTFRAIGVADIMLSYRNSDVALSRIFGPRRKLTAMQS